MGRVNISRHATPDICTIFYLEKYFSGCRISVRTSVTLVFVTVPYLQSFARRIEMSQMNRVSMSHLRCVQSFAVMVDGTRAVDNLIASVTVYVTYPKVMITLSGIVFTTGMVTVENPAFFQFLSIPVVCSQYCTGIISTTHHNTRMDTVEVGNASQKAVTTITTIVSPVHQVSSSRYVINCLHRFSCQSVKNSQIFRSGQNTSLFIPIVSLRFSNHFSFSVHCSVGGFHYYFRFTVTIEVKHHKLGVVCTGTYITSQINAP